MEKVIDLTGSKQLVVIPPAAPIPQHRWKFVFRESGKADRVLAEYVYFHFQHPPSRKADWRVNLALNLHRYLMPHLPKGWLHQHWNSQVLPGVIAIINEYQAQIA